MSKETGDFLGGVPKACFNNDNPCVGVAGNREQLEKATTTAVSSVSKPPTSGSYGSDTSHLSNARAVQQAPCSATQLRHGWHPNLSNLKGK